jgi:hypothetical protein
MVPLSPSLTPDFQLMLALTRTLLIRVPLHRRFVNFDARAARFLIAGRRCDR